MNIYYYGELLNEIESKAIAVKKLNLSFKKKGRYLLMGLALGAGFFTCYNLNKDNSINNSLDNINFKTEQNHTIEHTSLEEKLNLDETKEKREKSIEINETNYDALDNLIEKQISKYMSNPQAITSLKNSFSKLSRYDDYIDEASVLTNNSVNILYSLYSTESDGYMRALSEAGAAGPAQVMPGTAREMGLKVGPFIDERYGPESLIKASEYLGKHVKSDKDYVIFAAYNFGPGNVNKIIKKYGDEWKEFSVHLPKETYNYVIRLKARAKLFDQLSFNKKELFSKELENSDKYDVKKGDYLFAIAKKTKSTVKEIKKLNPTIRDYNLINEGMSINIPKSL